MIKDGIVKDELEFYYDGTDIVCFRLTVDDDKDWPFEVGVEREHGIMEELLITTAEAKAILKFLKKHLEPKLENV